MGEAFRADAHRSEAIPMSSARTRALAAALAGALVVALGPAATTQAAPAPTCAAPAPETPKRQMRALWIASVQNLDWPRRTGEATAKAQYTAELDYAVAHRFNAVIVQIRP